MEIQVNGMETCWTDVFLENGTACADRKDGEMTRVFEEPESSSRVGGVWLRVRDGVAEPGKSRTIKWGANKQKADDPTCVSESTAAFRSQQHGERWDGGKEG